MKTKQLNVRVSEEEYNKLVEDVLKMSLKQNRIISLSEGVLIIIMESIKRRKMKDEKEEHINNNNWRRIWDH